MSQANSWDVLWSPSNPKKFIKYNTSDVSSDVCLYQLFHGQDYLQSSVNKGQVEKLADDIFVSQVSLSSEFSSIKSVAWCPRKDFEDHCVLAVGLSNGRVSLVNVGQEQEYPSGLLLNQEFSPKVERTCHELAWNVQEPNLLAVGLDKVRYDNSLLVWDVETKSSLSNGYDANSYNISTSRKSPVFAHASAEPIYSVRWLPQFSRTLVAGVSKWLRLFDMRNPTPKVIATTYAMFGICVDPFNANRIASFAEEQTSNKQINQGAVLVWDIRHAEKPLVTINQTKPVSKILWSPTRNHLISVLQKDSKAVKCYDLQYISSGNSFQYSNTMDGINESIPYERNVQLPKTSKYNMSSYSWHPSVDNIILGVSAIGKLYYLTIHERIVMSWSPSLDLVWGCGKKMMIHYRTGNAMEEDISFLMKRRAKDGYGIPAIMKDEKRLREVLQDPVLLERWNWLKRARKIKEHAYDRKNRKFHGVKAILKGEMVVSENLAQKLKGNDKETAQVNGNNGSYLSFSKKYSSDERKLALILCSWDLTSNDMELKLKKLCQDGEPERAAAMALFHNKLSFAINILSDSTASINKITNKSEPSLPIVAMALSGYSENKQALWSKNCKSLSAKLQNPYLRAIFAFLTTEDTAFSNVLVETGMLLEDRIAFACMYLSDSKLIDYIEEVTDSMVQNGGLEGLLLTGLTPDGLQLLENYITKTSDVQTAVLIILNTKVTEVFKEKDARVNNWIENYRDLLDNWRLWHERAQFDALVHNTDSSRKIPQQISVTCTYCSKPVSANLFAHGGTRIGRFPQGFGNSRMNKAMSCPGCHQPLPRCSVCLIGMGSLSSHLPRGIVKPKLDNIVNSFSNWFTWCQMCRHGGHAVHLMEWFSEHVECPIIGCSCGCNAQDSVAMVSTQGIKIGENDVKTET